MALTIPKVSFQSNKQPQTDANPYTKASHPKIMGADALDAHIASIFQTAGIKDQPVVDEFLKGA